MDFAENKLELSIAGLILLMMAGLFHLFGSLHGQSHTEGDIIYEMPRPKSFQGADFDLSGREIERDYINPFVKKDGKAPVKDGKKAVQIGAKKAAAKKTVAAKTEAKKTPKLTTRVIEKDASAALADSAVNQNSYRPGVIARGAPVSADTNAQNQDKKEDTKLSPDQWMALILAQPTQANMNKLIEARNKAEIDSGTYNSIVAELLKNSKADVQDLGLYGAQTFPDASSFVTVVQNKDHLESAEQAKAESFLQTYTQTSRLGSLVGVLSSTDSAVVEKATEIVLAGYQAAKNGTSISTTPRPGRGDTVQTSSAPVDSYKAFLSVYQELAQSSDGSIASIANSALSALSALAQNTTV